MVWEKISADHPEPLPIDKVKEARQAACTATKRKKNKTSKLARVFGERSPGASGPASHPVCAVTGLVLVCVWLLALLDDAWVFGALGSVLDVCTTAAA